MAYRESCNNPEGDTGGKPQLQYKCKDKDNDVEHYKIRWMTIVSGFLLISL